MTERETIKHISNILNTKLHKIGNLYKTYRFTLYGICYLDSNITIKVFSEQDKTTVINALYKSDKLLITSIDDISCKRYVTYIYLTKIDNLKHISI